MVYQDYEEPYWLKSRQDQILTEFLQKKHSFRNEENLRFYTDLNRFEDQIRQTQILTVRGDNLSADVHLNRWPEWVESIRELNFSDLKKVHFTQVNLAPFINLKRLTFRACRLIQVSSTLFNLNPPAYLPLESPVLLRISTVVNLMLINCDVTHSLIDIGDLTSCLSFSFSPLNRFDEKKYQFRLPPSLIQLYLNNMDIRDIETLHLDRLRQLENLDLTNLNLTNSIDFSIFPRLKSLVLRINPIRFPSTVRFPSSLQSLYLDRMNLRRLPPRFDLPICLKRLDLSGNGLSVCPNIWLLTQLESFADEGNGYVRPPYIERRLKDFLSPSDQFKQKYREFQLISDPARQSLDRLVGLHLASGDSDNVIEDLIREDFSLTFPHTLLDSGVSNRFSLTFQEVLQIVYPVIRQIVPAKQIFGSLAFTEDLDTNILLVLSCLNGIHSSVTF